MESRAKVVEGNRKLVIMIDGERGVGLGCPEDASAGGGGILWGELEDRLSFQISKRGEKPIRPDGGFSKVFAVDPDIEKSMWLAFIKMKVAANSMFLHETFEASTGIHGNVFILGTKNDHRRRRVCTDVVDRRYLFPVIFYQSMSEAFRTVVEHGVVEH